ncbi:MAG: cupredoxin domain-containing protein, partial [Gammaproteobacteria bacterium]|nr:cupredoxin domain-containing protein [Gammaproteobacteria bacterium]
VGPFIRGASEGSIRAAIDATNEMLVVKQSITDSEVSAVAAYLRYLGTMQVVRTLAKRGRFLPDQASVRPGTRIQLVVQNAGLDTHTFRSDNMGMADVVIPGRSAASREWLAPGEEGEFSLYCIDCKLDKQSLTLRVDKAAQEFVPGTPLNAPAAGSGM